MNIECPQCHHVQSEEEGAFCEECGAPLQRPSADRTVVDLTPWLNGAGAAEPPGKDIDFSKHLRIIDEKAQPSPRKDAATSEECFPSDGDVTPSDGGGTADIAVAYPEKLFFVSGNSTPLTIKITPRVDVEAIDLWYSPQLAKVKCSPVYHVECYCPFEKGRTSNVEIPCEPEETLSGIVPVRFYFCVRRRESLRYYAMSARHIVYGVKPDAQNIIQLTANQAGTINFAGFQMPKTPEARLEMLYSLAATYFPMTLEETRWRPERGASGNLFSCDRLTLKLGDFRMQLLCLETTRLGRQLECNDIIVADLLNARNLKEYPNNAISRKHAQIHYCGDSVNLFDTSSAGTFINDQRPTEQGVAIPREAEVSFGSGIHWKMEMQRCELRPDDPVCINCLARKIRSLVFTRMDRVPEAYLLVWQCCDLGRIREELTDFQVLRRDGGFLLKTPSGELVALVPGRTIAFGRGNRLEVEEFRQYGL